MTTELQKLRAGFIAPWFAVPRLGKMAKHWETPFHVDGVGHTLDDDGFVTKQRDSSKGTTFWPAAEGGRTFKTKVVNGIHVLDAVDREALSQGNFAPKSLLAPMADSGGITFFIVRKRQSSGSLAGGLISLIPGQDARALVGMHSNAAGNLVCYIRHRSTGGPVDQPAITTGNSHATWRAWAWRINWNTMKHTIIAGFGGTTDSERDIPPDSVGDSGPPEIDENFRIQIMPPRYGNNNAVPSRDEVAKLFFVPEPLTGSALTDRLAECSAIATAGGIGEMDMTQEEMATAALAKAAMGETITRNEAVAIAGQGAMWSSAAITLRVDIERRVATVTLDPDPPEGGRIIDARPDERVVISRQMMRHQDDINGLIAAMKAAMAAGG